jgi:DNA polymerase III subunit epsilon
MIKKCYLDVETTGADEKRHAIHQIAGLIEVDGKLQEEFDIKCRPHDGAEFDRKVMINFGLKKEELMAYPSPKMGYELLLEILGSYVDKFNKEDKFFFIAYFGFFDERFLRALFERMEDNFFGSWFFVPAIDVATIACYKLMKDRHHLENFKLGTVAKFLGIEVDPSRQHEALYDIYLTKAVMDKLEGK